MSENNRIVISQVMMPSQANPNGNVHGGEIMKMMDSTAYAAARKYARSNVVTARVDELEFHQPILIGDLVTCTAEIVFVGHSSMEVTVTVEVEDLDQEGRPQRALAATSQTQQRSLRIGGAPAAELRLQGLCQCATDGQTLARQASLQQVECGVELPTVKGLALDVGECSAVQPVDLLH